MNTIEELKKKNAYYERIISDTDVNKSLEANKNNFKNEVAVWLHDLTLPPIPATAKNGSKRTLR